MGSLDARTPKIPKDTAVNPACSSFSSQGISSSKQSTIKYPMPNPNALAPIIFALAP